jgi:pyruvate/2-oxoglutarate dehydrogenase complex dihydrolipoamide acyltransferase (E2) component
MPTIQPILMPEIGAEGHPIRVVQWLADLGSEVLAGDRVLEVLTVGVLFSVSSGHTGVLFSRDVAPGSEVQTGDRLGSISVSEEAL